MGLPFSIPKVWYDRPQIILRILHLCPETLLSRGIPSSYFLFLSLFSLVSSAPANHTLHTARPSECSLLQGRPCPCTVAWIQQDLHERLPTGSCFQLRRAAAERWFSRRQGEGHTPLLPALCKKRVLAQRRSRTISDICASHS